MPSVTIPDCPRYIEQRWNLDFTDLAIIDPSKTLTPEGAQSSHRSFVMAFAPMASSTPSIMAILKPMYLLPRFILPVTHLQDMRDRIFDIANVPFTAVRRNENIYCRPRESRILRRI
ncbi:hypothetical protein JVU11DRAFT_8221 [Chiua virens]|nr:hypothetical protein JVU11DRAFT_11944 [Chiua virens]KAG9311155.1 hypothetical protein JVU11DRAFT_8221 [Chiua virens]